MSDPAVPALEALRLAPAAGRARQLVVLCHGIGTDGADLMPIARLLAGVLPETAFAAPHAPHPFSLGPEGRQWFELFGRSAAEVEAGARAAAPALARFFAEECTRLGLPARAGVLAGFSQGAMMALYAGLRMADPPGGIAAFAGGLPGSPATLGEIPTGGRRPVVLLAHGEADEIVPAAFSREAERILRGLGLAVHALYRPGLGHGLDDEILGAFAAFCADLAGAAGPGRA